MSELPIDKSTWGEGPWLHEPDEKAWSYGDVPCRIVRHPRHGNLNGYVGLGATHPWYEKEYDDLQDVSVHGGLTFSGRFAVSTFATQTEHDAMFWWIGFDCAHAWDLSPGMKALLIEVGMPETAETIGPPEVYRTIEYVTIEVEDLAQQAIKAMRAATDLQRLASLDFEPDRVGEKDLPRA